MADETLRILVVDDDASVTTLVRTALEAQGFEVRTANDGQHGLELAFTEHPHLVLLDVMMPGMDGYVVCRELQNGSTRDIPVVFLTAKTELTDMVKANEAGASRYITKPFRVDHLLQTVREVLRDASVYVDEITGLPTLANVQVEVQRMLFRRTELGVMYITLDGIEALEQLQGFEVVDDVLRSVTRRLMACRGKLIRREDIVSISSLGNAFLIVLSPPRDQEAVLDDDLLAIKRRLEEQLLAGIERELRERLLVEVSLYVGYARLTQSPKVRFKRALLEAIDRAERGIQVERDATRRHLRRELDRLIDGDQLSCVSQPIVSLDDFGVLGYELLARGPRQSPLHLPDLLFDVARSAGREAELDRLCRLAAARTATTLPAATLRFINIEPSSLAGDDGARLMGELLDAVPAEARSQTIVELTETSVIDDFAHMRKMVRTLRSHGFRIAVDDVGAGYAGLQTIVELEPDFMKLDISLTRGIEASLVKRRLLARLRDFCRDAGVTLIAEGIETRAQLDTLLALGIPYGQGFLFARPSSQVPSPNPILPPLEPHEDAARLSPPASVIESRPL